MANRTYRYDVIYDLESVSKNFSILEDYLASLFLELAKDDGFDLDQLKDKGNIVVDFFVKQIDLYLMDYEIHEISFAEGYIDIRINGYIIDGDVELRIEEYDDDENLIREEEYSLEAIDREYLEFSNATLFLNYSLQPYRDELIDIKDLELKK
jgi:hypothetical protein